MTQKDIIITQTDMIIVITASFGIILLLLLIFYLGEKYFIKKW